MGTWWDRREPVMQLATYVAGYYLRRKKEEHSNPGQYHRYPKIGKRDLNQVSSALRHIVMLATLTRILLS
jgi:hypothetical protein